MSIYIYIYFYIFKLIYFHLYAYICLYINTYILQLLVLQPCSFSRIYWPVEVWTKPLSKSLNSVSSKK